ncbi:DUF4233 domain-containing protein [Nocardioidaceae bacterium SCSIO 66511]|nr:DUF4233 domain-containing protein [Nocardioidaceae bacterium SCSIO 66511]
MRGMCAAMLFFEAIVLGLATPVMIAVEDVDTTVALVTGLGLALAALVVSGLLRWPWAYNLGHALQIAAIALGILVPIMFFIGAMFAALWLGAFLLGRKIEADKAARST